MRALRVWPALLRRVVSTRAAAPSPLRPPHPIRCFSSLPPTTQEHIESDDVERPFLFSSPPLPAASPSTPPASLSIPRPTVPTHLHGYPITLTPLPSPSPTFHSLKLPSHLCHRLHSLGYTSPSLIQSAVLPHLTSPPTSSQPSADLLITDSPGEGKTLSYLLPQLSRLSPYLHALQSIILVPSREVAIQVARTVAELTEGGRKARQRNPLRVDLAVGRVNPSMVGSLTRPKPLPPLTAKDKRDPQTPPREWQAEWEEEVGVERCPVPQLLIGTVDVVWELLVKRELLDTSHLSFFTIDEADSLIHSPDTAQRMVELLRLRREGVDGVGTQVLLVSSLVTPAVLHFAALHLSRQRLLLTPASVPSECERRHRFLLTASSTSPKTGRPMQLQLPQLSPYTSHHFARMPASVTPKEKGEMLLQLCVAIRDSFRATHPKVGQPEWIRHESSQLRMGMAAVPPLSPHPPQTTLVVFRSRDQMFPLLSLFSSHLRIAMLSSASSRSERREGLSMSPPAEVVLAEGRLVRGLDLKAVNCVVMWDVVGAGEYYLRAGRCGRKGQVHREGRVITMVRDGQGEEEKLQKMVRAMGGRGVTQLVVRGERLYERGRSALRQPIHLPQKQLPRAQDLPPLRYIDDLRSGGQRLHSNQ